jgi:extracellular factor (EF) 3-hydroxypalmitic acid methyl ester biosynthesis protein
MATTTSVRSDIVTDSYILGRTKQGVELRAPLLKLAPYKAVFELFQVPPDLRVSQTLENFKIMVAEKPIYEGRAVTSSLVTFGSGLVCEATLEDSWVDPNFHANTLRETGGRSVFNQFIQQWQNTYRIHSQFKAVVADMQMFLTDMRMWLDQVELGSRAKSAEAMTNDSLEIAAELSAHTLPVITTLFENFERELRSVDADHQPGYENFSKRQLHRLLLCSPFLHRTYSKPLGYAGDYEMVNMICRNPYEGDSLYAKLVNHWFIQQAPAEAHRNRIQFLTDRLVEGALDARRHGRQPRFISIGCGPAQEIQRFIAESELSDNAYVRLVDFNEETANYTLTLLETLKRRYGRKTQIDMVRKSVHQILKEGGRAAKSQVDHFDFVYCAGLFDYLTDQTCHRLTNILYEQVSPGGMFVSTNVDIYNPRRLTMDYLMDWHLIYRNGRELADLRPNGINQEFETVTADDTATNIYYTLRKPARA